MPEEPEFELGDLVGKKSGYRFPGIVVSSFRTLEGHIRYVVQG
jgi:hypothetical protein